jgi:hypothetical protein
MEETSCDKSIPIGHLIRSKVKEAAVLDKNKKNKKREESQPKKEKKVNRSEMELLNRGLFLFFPFW